MEKKRMIDEPVYCNDLELKLYFESVTMVFIPTHLYLRVRRVYLTFSVNIRLIDLNVELRYN